jgi:uncharacterized protein with PQ loop repeat
MYTNIIMFGLFAGFEFNFQDLYGLFTKLASESYIAFFITIPISFLLFLIYNKLQHKILINLGDQKWLIDND